MAVAGYAAKRRRGFGSLAFPLYLGLMALILFFYFRGLLQLLPFRERIMGGTQLLSVPKLSPVGLFLTLAIILLCLVYYKQVLVLVSRIPAGVRGLILPLPCYVLLSGDVMVGAGVAVLAAVVWLLYRPLGSLLLRSLRTVPAGVLLPLGRFWPAVLYTALFTKSILPTILGMLIMFGYHYLDSAVERLFLPVWDWYRGLPTKSWLGIFASRLVVGVTVPFVLSYHFAWFNWGYDRMTPLYGVVISLIAYFVMRMPRGGGAGGQGV